MFAVLSLVVSLSPFKLVWSFFTLELRDSNLIGILVGFLEYRRVLPGMSLILIGILVFLVCCTW